MLPETTPLARPERRHAAARVAPLLAPLALVLAVSVYLRSGVLREDSVAPMQTPAQLSHWDPTTYLPTTVKPTRPAQTPAPSVTPVPTSGPVPRPSYKPTYSPSVSQVPTPRPTDPVPTPRPTSDTPVPSIVPLAKKTDDR